MLYKAVQQESKQLKCDRNRKTSDKFKICNQTKHWTIFLLTYFQLLIDRTKIESYTSRSFEAPGKHAMCAMIPLLRNISQ